jgi:hypothetical protein
MEQLACGGVRGLLLRLLQFEFTVVPAPLSSPPSSTKKKAVVATAFLLFFCWGGWSCSDSCDESPMMAGDLFGISVRS